MPEEAPSTSKALIIFDRTHCTAREMALKLKAEGLDAILISPNADRIFNLSTEGFKAQIPRDFFTEDEIVSLDRECFRLDESLFVHNGRDYSEFAGVSLMGLAQYALVPPIIRAWRDLASAKRAIELHKPSRVIIIGSDSFTDAARIACRAAGVMHEDQLSGRLRSMLSSLRELYRQRSTGWQQSTFKYIALESILDIWMYAEGIIKRFMRGRRDSTKTGPRLIFTGDTYSGLDLHRHLKDNPEWELHTCGMDLRLRRRLFPEVRPIEVFFRPWMLVDVFRAHMHMRRAWAALKLDASYRARFNAEGLDAWPLLRHTLGIFAKHYAPRLMLHYLTGREAFRQRPEQSVLVVPSDVMPYTKALVLAARAEGAKSLVIQHGFLGMINGHDAIHADMLAGWGKGTLEWYAALGVKESKIAVTGNPRYDVYAGAKPLSDEDAARMRQELGLRPDGPVITVLTSWFNDFTVASSAIDELNMAEYVIGSLAEMGLAGECTVILKTHPAVPGVPFEHEMKRWRAIVPEIKIMKTHLREAISLSALCVGIPSSTMIECMLMGVPFVSYEAMRYRNAPYAEDLRKFKAAACTYSHAEMRDELKELMTGPGAREKAVLSHKAYLDYFISGRDGLATERVFRLVGSLAGALPKP